MFPGTKGAPFNATESAMMRDGPEPIADRPTVLIAEDEENVRDVLQLVLEASGHRVLSAASVPAALELARSGTASIDLLITDLRIPGGSGCSLASRLRQIHPQMRVLVVSGYYRDRLEPSDVQGARYLQKPFALDELQRIVGELLADCGPQ